MKVAVTAIFFAALALATPAPLAQPDAAPAPLSEMPSFAPEVDARAAGLILESRDPSPKKSKGNKGNKGGNDSNSTEEGAASAISSNRMLELGALGLSVLLWV